MGLVIDWSDEIEVVRTSSWYFGTTLEKLHDVDFSSAMKLRPDETL